jgi:hypothetical protein
MQIHSVGIDLGKTTFHLVALGAAGSRGRGACTACNSQPVSVVRTGDGALGKLGLDLLK